MRQWLVYFFCAGMLSRVAFAADAQNITSIGLNTHHTNIGFHLIKLLESENFPSNELGFDQEETYVSDIGGYWSYSSLHYYRFTPAGIFGARFNRSTRYATGGEQYVLEAYPKLFQGSYLTLTAALSNSSQQVYPHYQYVVEPYFQLPHGFEISAGMHYIKTFNTSIYTYTGMIGKNWQDYYFWFRPYHYTPKSVDYFEVGVKKYFAEKTYVSVKAGTGKTPDIGDVPPLNQIIILSTNTIGIDGQIPLYKNVYLKGGLGYGRQVYHSGNVREITDGSLGVTWQF